MTHDVPACLPVDQAGSTLYSQDVCIAITDGADLYRYEAYMLLRIDVMLLLLLLLLPLMSPLCHR